MKQMCLWAIALTVAHGVTGGVVRPSSPNPFIEAMLAAEDEDNIEVDTLQMVEFYNSSSICFKHTIGCFTRNDMRHSRELPDDPGKSMINMYTHLYSRANKDKPILITYENESSYTGLNFLKNSKKPLYLITHGFSGNSDLEWIVNMRKTLLTVQDAYVLAVDWRRGSGLPFYNKAVSNALSVGRAVGYLLARICQIYDYNPKNIHFIGFSMGAQVGGFAGRHFYNLTKVKFGRMTLLDPAAPQFEKFGVHVQKKDSDFTVAIHTSAGKMLITGRVGMTKPVGHVDFYVNGGHTQPKCHFYELTCHHYRAHEYFTEAILNSANPKACHFKARRCLEEITDLMKNKCTVIDDTVGEMSLNSSGEGVMYVKTNGASPYCVRPSVDENNEV